MKNRFIIEVTEDGFTETLVYEGKTYVKRYVKTERGYDGYDRAWDEEKELQDNFDLIDSLEERDPLYIMDALVGGAGDE